MLAAAAFTAALLAQAPASTRAAAARYAEQPAHDRGAASLELGIPMREIFALAKEFREMPPDEIAVLLANPLHGVRIGAVSIMGKQAMHKRASEARRKELFDLYLASTSQINTWGLVDVSAHQVVGAYLIDKPRTTLDTLARSADWWERRIAIFSTLALVRAGQVEDTFRIAEALLGDDEHFVQTATGGLLREAGKVDPARLKAFLDVYAATMPRITLRFATEKLSKDDRGRYRAAKRGNRQLDSA